MTLLQTICRAEPVSTGRMPSTDAAHSAGRDWKISWAKSCLSAIYKLCSIHITSQFSQHMHKISRNQQVNICTAIHPGFKWLSLRVFCFKSVLSATGLVVTFFWLHQACQNCHPNGKQLGKQLAWFGYRGYAYTSSLCQIHFGNT